MPYTHVTRTPNGAEAISYIRGIDGKGHNNADHRNEYVTGINMLPDSVVPFEQQMQPYWDKADPRHTTQLDRFILAFSRKELDPEDPEQVHKGHNIACEVARELFPGHQAIVATQIDGKGGLVHCHIGVNDVNMETFKGLEKFKYKFSYFSKEMDRICERYIDPDYQDPIPERESRKSRGVRVKNEKIREKNAQEIEAAQKEGRAPVLIPEEYIWRDDLKERIKEAATGAADEADFFSRLRSHGVEVERRDATKRQPEYYLYELVDTSGFTGKIPENLKAKSFKLGDSYQPKGIAKQLGTPAAVHQTTRPVITIPEIPASPVPVEQPTLKKQVQKPPEKPKTDDTMEEAKSTARACVFNIMQQTYDWPVQPKEIDENGQEWDDSKEIGRQWQETTTAFDRFTLQWRVDRRKEGRKLPGIYEKDKTTGRVRVLYDELEAQFREYLDWQDHPEKYAVQRPQQEQQPSQEQPEQPQDSQPQETPQAEPSQAEQQRKQLAGWQAAMQAELTPTKELSAMEKLNRLNAKNEREWVEQAGKKKEDGIDYP